MVGTNLPNLSHCFPPASSFLRIKNLARPSHKYGTASAKDQNCNHLAGLVAFRELLFRKRNGQVQLNKFPH
jgi:hypothetical protein